jgi:DNA-binding beta-propeller fold protein YncE
VSDSGESRWTITARKSAALVAVAAVAVVALMILSAGYTSASAVRSNSAAGSGLPQKATFSSTPTMLAKSKLKHFTVGEGPNRAAYDPVNHDLYVPESTAHQVQVFSSKNKLVGTVALPSGSYPGAAAFDGSNDNVYVTGEDSNAVYEISGTTLTATITGPSIGAPYGIVYDPGDGIVAVADGSTNNVTGIENGGVVTVTHVGSEPFGITYDPYWANLVVTNFGSNNVTCLSALYLTVVGNRAVGSDPTGIAFDPATNLDYVANFGGSNVSVIGGNCVSIKSISGFDAPDGVGYDQATLQVFVTNVGNGKVDAIGTSSTVVKTYTTASSADPVDATYDAYNDDVYVGGFGDAVGTSMYVIP